MDRSVLVIILALSTLALVMAWAYLSKRQAKAELGDERPLTGNTRIPENTHEPEETAPARNEAR